MRQAAHTSDRVARIRASDVTPAIVTALGAADPEAVREITAALDTLASHFSPRGHADRGTSA